MNRSLPGAGNIPGKGNCTWTEALHPFTTYLVSAIKVLVNCMTHWTSQTVLVLLQRKDSRKWNGKQGFGQSILSVTLKGMKNPHRRQSKEVTTSDWHLFEYLLSWDHSPHPRNPRKKKNCLENLLRANTVPNAVTHAIVPNLHLQLAEMARQWSLPKS